MIAAVTYLVIVGFSILHAAGIGFATLKWGDFRLGTGIGCMCHGLAYPTDTVYVWVAGPRSVYVGSTYTYTISIVGGPSVNGGFNVDAGSGQIAPADSTSYLIDYVSELTHTRPKPFQSGIVQWNFTYRPPAQRGLDTIFSVGNSTVGDINNPSIGDEWNYGKNFVVTILDTTLGVERDPLPFDFMLAQNYPNPFNPSTLISYRLDHEMSVSLSVYDLTGKLVAVLVDGLQQKGSYSSRFSGAGLASGIYFYRLQATSKTGDNASDNGHFVVTKKMVLSK